MSGRGYGPQWTRTLLSAMQNRNAARQQQIRARGYNAANTTEGIGRSIMDAVGTYANYKQGEPYRQQAQAVVDRQNTASGHRIRLRETWESMPDGANKVEYLSSRGFLDEANDLMELEESISSKANEELKRTREGLKAFGTMLEEFEPELATLRENPDRYDRVYATIQQYAGSAQVDENLLESRLPSPEDFAGLGSSERSIVVDGLIGVAEKEKGRALSASEARNWGEMVYRTIEGEDDPEKATALVDSLLELDPENPGLLAAKRIVQRGGAETLGRFLGLDVEEPDKPANFQSISRPGGSTSVFNPRTGTYAAGLPAPEPEAEGGVAPTPGEGVDGISPEQQRVFSVIDNITGVLGDVDSLKVTAEAEGRSVTADEMTDANYRIQTETSKLGLNPGSLVPGMSVFVRTMDGTVEEKSNLTPNQIRNLKWEISRGFSALLPKKFASGFNRRSMSFGVQ